jgi:hypothetical protein
VKGFSSRDVYGWWLALTATAGKGEMMVKERKFYLLMLFKNQVSSISAIFLIRTNSLQILHYVSNRLQQ